MSVLTIAEIGVNHGGDLRLAHKMIEAAKWAGADVAKFQFYDPDKVLGAFHPFNEYAWSCQFTKPQHYALKKHCDEIGIEYMVSVFDLEDVGFMDRTCQRVKIATRMNNNAKFLREAKETGKPILISKPVPTKSTDSQITTLYCLAHYPTQIEEYKKTYLEVCEGFSTHCPDIAPALYACAHNCKVVEAHVTFSRAMKGCDMSSSWTFDELAQFVKTVKAWERV